MSNNSRCGFPAKRALSGAAVLAAIAAAMPAPPAAAADLHAQMQDLAWLTGVWGGQNHEDQIEEVYGPLSGDEIIGTFKAVTHGQVSRYELRSLRRDGDAIIFQELAYGAAFAPRPPVATRKLLSTDASHVNFEGLTLTHTSPNRMHVKVNFATPDGSRHWAQFDLTRVLKTVAP